MRWLLALWLAGCGGGDGENSPAEDGGGPADAGPSNDTTSAAVHVGTGYEEFVAVEDGGEVTIIAGPQGGYHIFTSVRVYGLEMDSVEAEVTIRLATTGEYVGPAATALFFDETGDGWFEAVGLFNFVNDPDPVRDQEVLLRGEATDGTGARSFDERRAIAR